MTVTARSLLAEALGLPLAAVDDRTSFATCAQWDSLAHFRVIAAIEAAIERRLSTPEIFEATDYDKVARLIAGR